MQPGAGRRFLKTVLDIALGRAEEPEISREDVWDYRASFDADDQANMLKAMKLVEKGKMDGILFIGDIRDMMDYEYQAPRLLVAGLKTLRGMGPVADRGIEEAAKLCSNCHDEVRPEAARTVAFLACDILEGGREMHYDRVAGALPKLAGEIRHFDALTSQASLAALVQIGDAAFRKRVPIVADAVVEALPTIAKHADCISYDPEARHAQAALTALQESMVRWRYPAVLPELPPGRSTEGPGPV